MTKLKPLYTLYYSLVTLILLYVVLPSPALAVSPLSVKNFTDGVIIKTLSLYPQEFTPLTPTPSVALTPTSTLPPSPVPIQTGYCLHIPIILYHHIQPYMQAQQEGHAQLTVDTAFFEQHLAYLKNAGYRSITIEELAHALTHNVPLPPKSIAITIDDGYLDNYVYAYQLLKKYNMVGNFMIPPGLMETPGYMTWSQIHEMNAGGQAIYNHTWSHTSLGGASRDIVVREIASANQKLEQETGKKITVFTYPYGSFDNQAVSVLKELGFVIGLTTIPGRVQCDNNIMTLYRDHVGNAPLSVYGL